MKEIKICPCCGQKIVSYKHNLNRVLVKGLSTLYRAGGLSRLDKLNLTHSEFTNFQKLRYFGLAVQSGQNRMWQITNKGNAFLRGLGKCESYIITTNGRITERSDKLIGVCDVKECVCFKEEWQEQAKSENLFDFLKKM